MGPSNNKQDMKSEDQVFFIRIQYRRNSSWQGTIQWLNGRETCIFRSVLELGNLINNAREEASGDKTKSEKTKIWKNRESVS